MPDSSNIPVYNPAQADPDALAKFFIDRKLRSKGGWLDSRKREVEGGTLKSEVLTGLRGSGKTTCLVLLEDLIRDSAAQKYLAIRPSEDWFHAIHSHKRYVESIFSLTRLAASEACGQDGKKAMRPLEAWTAEQTVKKDGLAEAYAVWLKAVGELGRVPVLLVENLDQLVSRLAKVPKPARDPWLGVGAGRPGHVLVGTATVYGEETEEAVGIDRTVLANFDEEETLEVARRLGMDDKRIPEMRAMHLLTGGLPRAIVHATQLFRKGLEPGLIGDLQKLLDDVTPLYKARTEELPINEQEIFDAVARNVEPMLMKELAAETGHDPDRNLQNLSSVLSRMVRSGILAVVTGEGEKKAPGRNRWEIQERFWALWYLWRHGTERQEAIRQLARFLSMLFSAEKLEESRRLALEGAADPMYREVLEEAVRQKSPKTSDRFDEQGHSVISSNGVNERETLDVMEGRRLALAGDFAGAIKKVEGAASNNAAAALVLGYCLLEDPLKWEAAKAAYERAIALAPKLAYPHHGLGVLLSKRPEAWEAAKAAFERAIALDPKYAYPHNGLGNLLSTRPEEWEAAKAAYERAIALDPGFVAPHNGLGNLLSKRPEEWEAAKAAYERAIALDPKFAAPHNNLGNLLSKRPEEWEAAKAAYERAIALDPKDASPHNGLGNLLSKRPEEWEAAKSAFERAIALDPKSATPHNNLGNLLSKRPEEWEAAKAAYERAIALDPKFATPHNNLGVLLSKRPEESEAAKSAYERAIALDPTLATVISNLGELLREREGYEQTALERAMQALNLDENIVYSWETLFVVFRKMSAWLESRMKDASARAEAGLTEKTDAAVAWAAGRVGLAMRSDDKAKEGLRLMVRIMGQELDAGGGDGTLESAGVRWRQLMKLLREMIEVDRDYWSEFVRGVLHELNMKEKWKPLDVTLEAIAEKNREKMLEYSSEVRTVAGKLYTQLMND